MSVLRIGIPSPFCLWKQQLNRPRRSTEIEKGQAEAYFHNMRVFSFGNNVGGRNSDSTKKVCSCGEDACTDVGRPYVPL